MGAEVAIFEILTRHGVPFVIVGGHAVYVHGHQRQTEDVDVVWRRSAESEVALAAALAELDARYIGNEIDPATGIERMHEVSVAFIRSRHLMMLWTKLGFLDLFDYIPGHANAEVDELFATSVESPPYRFASLEWLRKMKQASGRAKDVEDLKNLPET